MNKYILPIALLTASGAALAADVTSTFTTTHKYLTEFNETDIAFSSAGGASYQELFHCLCASSTLDRGNHNLTVDLVAGTGTGIVDASTAGFGVVKSTVGSGTAGTNLSPGVANAVAADLEMVKTSQDNHIFQAANKTPDFYLLEGVTTTSGNVKKPLASLQVRVFGAQNATEGVAIANVGYGTAGSTVTGHVAPGFSRLAGTILQQIGGNAAAVAKWNGGTQTTVAGNLSPVAGGTGSVSTAAMTRVISDGKNYPFAANAGGICDGENTFTSGTVAAQNCGNHPILGIALSTSKREAAGSWKIKLTVAGSASPAHT